MYLWSVQTVIYLFKTASCLGDNRDEKRSEDGSSRPSDTTGHETTAYAGKRTRWPTSYDSRKRLARHWWAAQTHITRSVIVGCDRFFPRIGRSEGWRGIKWEGPRMTAAVVGQCTRFALHRSPRVPPSTFVHAAYRSHFGWTVFRASLSALAEDFKSPSYYACRGGKPHFIVSTRKTK